jgi:tripartite ATP-independent transporter DctP family solute receptor
MKRRMLNGLVIVFAVSLICTISAGGAFAQKKIELAIAIHTDPGHFCYTIGERVKKDLEKKSQGRIAVRLLGMEVGGERDHLEGGSRGEYQIALGGSVPLTLYAPKFSAPDLPFVFPDTAATKKLYQGTLGQLMNESIIKSGNMRLIGLSPRNPRNLTANKSIKNPDELKGVKIRVPEIMPWVKVWKELGGLATPVAWPEVYSALQTGTIEAQENPVENILTGRIYEVQKYLMLTKHVYSFFHWLMNEKFYQGLTAGDRKMILDTVSAETKWGEDFVFSGEKEMVEKLQKSGMQIVTPDVNAFRKKAAPAIRELAKNYHPEVEKYVLSFLKD